MGDPPSLLDSEVAMNKEEFLTKAKANPRPVVVDVWAPWCTPCRMIAPALQGLAGAHTGAVDVWKINADDEPGLARALGVLGIPRLIVYRNSSMRHAVCRPRRKAAQHCSIVYCAWVRGQRWPGWVSRWPEPGLSCWPARSCLSAPCAIAVRSGMHSCRA